jgi:hypothetical protein
MELDEEPGHAGIELLSGLGGDLLESLLGG